MNNLTVEKLNEYGRKSVPFVALISYDRPDADVVCPLEMASEQGISFRYEDDTLYNIENVQNPPNYILDIQPVDFETYKIAFDNAQQRMKKENVALINLCMKTDLQTNLSLSDIYRHSRAKLVVMYDKHFVCFSPEIFVEIENDKISTYPMKGTIGADIPNACEVLLNDPKEHNEQVAICQCMQQELSAVSTNVGIDKFRYFTKVKTVKGDIWQTSSQISGTLKPEYRREFGNLFEKLLPAGSISGTPKSKAKAIIKDVELCKRGFYSGVFVHFDGKI
jgi:para-aminobenzoate synthetase component 1